MSQFKSNLASLPSVESLARLEVVDAENNIPTLLIENKPGKAGSLAVYQYLFKEFGGITKQAAQRGLELFAEYTQEAREKPGSHPNIDFLLSVVESDREYRVHLQEK